MAPSCKNAFVPASAQANPGKQRKSLRPVDFPGIRPTIAQLRSGTPRLERATTEPRRPPGTEQPPRSAPEAPLLAPAGRGTSRTAVGSSELDPQGGTGPGRVFRAPGLTSRFQGASSLQGRRFGQVRPQGQRLATGAGCAGRIVGGRLVVRKLGQGSRPRRHGPRGAGGRARAVAPQGARARGPVPFPRRPHALDERGHAQGLGLLQVLLVRRRRERDRLHDELPQDGVHRRAAVARRARGSSPTRASSARTIPSTRSTSSGRHAA